MSAVTAVLPSSLCATRLPLSKRAPAALLSIALAALLAACGTVGPQTLRVGPGQTEAELLAAMGPPTGRYPLANGAQLVEYAKGPMGRVTFMFEVDSSGRIKTADQVLQRQYFSKVAVNMNQDEVQRIEACMPEGGVLELDGPRCCPESMRLSGGRTMMLDF